MDTKLKVEIVKNGNRNPRWDVVVNGVTVEKDCPTKEFANTWKKEYQTGNFDWYLRQIGIIQ